MTVTANRRDDGKARDRQIDALQRYVDEQRSQPMSVGGMPRTRTQKRRRRAAAAAAERAAQTAESYRAQAASWRLDAAKATGEAREAMLQMAARFDALGERPDHPVL